MSSTRPLSGIRVIDFGQYLAGPAVSMMLADQGAEVIRIDPVSGPFWDTPTNAILNRNKKSIALNLKEEKDLQIAQQLVASADVVVENFRPGVMDQLGLSARQMTMLNPALVYLSLPGFAHNDREWAQVQAWEATVGAAIGQFMDMGLNRVLMGINPSFSPLVLASGYAATLGSMSVSLALYAREKTGLGDIIEVPLATAMMEGLVYNSMNIENLPERYLSRREREIKRRQQEGIPMDMTCPELRGFLDPLYQNYICADGRPFYVVCASHTSHVRKIFEVLGIWEAILEAGIPMDDPYISSRGWAEDCTLWAYPFSKKWADFLTRKMEAAFLQKTSYEWEEIFGKNALPGAAHRETKEWIHSDHAIQSGLILEVDDSNYGLMRQAGNVAWLNGDAQNIVKKKPAPTLNEHREEILDELEQDVEDKRKQTRERSVQVHGESRPGWLSGVKILDLTNVIAGPTIASTLARFGADIIRIDNVKPTFDPWNTVIFGLQANRGKRSILVDLKSDEGKEIIEQIIKDVDVVTINAVDQQLERLGLTPEQLKTINPTIILCQIDAYGGPLPGPRSNYVGFDDLIQASTGIMARFGGSLDTPEEHAHLGTIDVLCGFCGAFALSVALLKRVLTGQSDVARSSLAAAGQLLQLPFMFDYEGRGPFDEPSGREAKGTNAFYRCYETQDGWVFLGIKPRHHLQLAVVPEFSTILSAQEPSMIQYLSDRFQQHPTSYWIETLQKLDIGICAINSMAKLRKENLFEEAGEKIDFDAQTMYFIRYQHQGLGRKVDICSPTAVRPFRSTAHAPSHAPKYGQHTREVLLELGYPASKIDSLISNKIVSESWSQHYLPD